MPVGAGLFPAGRFPAGFGQPETAPPPPTAALPDTSTGLSLTGRFINQQTKDYVFLPDGRLQGMQTVQQLVLLAINNIDLSTILEKGPNFQRNLASRVQAALSDLISRGLVQLLQVVVTQPGPDSGLATAYWRDLTTGKDDQTPIGTQ